MKIQTVKGYTIGLMNPTNPQARGNATALYELPSTVKVLPGEQPATG